LGQASKKAGGVISPAAWDIPVTIQSEYFSSHFNDKKEHDVKKNIKATLEERTKNQFSMGSYKAIRTNVIVLIRRCLK